MRDYIYQNGERVAMRIYGAQAGTYYFLNDHLGTPRIIINDAGQIVWQAAYLPFGKAQVLTETIVNNFRLPGQYYDNETGLHYNWHRYYDPAIGRYLRADPIGLDGGINLYAYAEANPIIKIDIFGLKTCGSGWNEPLVPDNPYGYFRFSSCCEDHDKCYGTCGKTQAECDNAFESCMLNRVS